jgi:hypothetical protein
LGLHLRELLRVSGKTIHDVARAAGVAIKTVSRALVRLGSPARRLTTVHQASYELGFSGNTGRTAGLPLQIDPSGIDQACASGCESAPKFGIGLTAAPRRNR